MSASQPPIERCRETDLESVALPVDVLETTTPDYLRELRESLSRRGQIVAELTVEAEFDEACSFATQAEAERLRDHVRAAAFLGATKLTVDVETVADEGKVRPALEACAERARREGVRLAVDGPIAIS